MLNNQTSISNQSDVMQLDRALQSGLLKPPSIPQNVQFVLAFHSLVNAPSFDLPLLEKIRRYPPRPALTNNYHALLIQMPQQYFVPFHLHKDRANQSLCKVTTAYPTLQQAMQPKQFSLFLADHSNKFCLSWFALILH